MVGGIYVVLKGKLSFIRTGILISWKQRQLRTNSSLLLSKMTHKTLRGFRIWEALFSSVPIAYKILKEAWHKLLWPSSAPGFLLSIIWKSFLVADLLLWILIAATYDFVCRSYVDSGKTAVSYFHLEETQTGLVLARYYFLMICTPWIHTVLTLRILIVFLDSKPEIYSIENSLRM